MSAIKPCPFCAALTPRHEAPADDRAATYEEILRTVCHHLELPQSESGPADDVALYDRALESLIAELKRTEEEKVEHRTARYAAEAAIAPHEAPAEGAGEIASAARALRRALLQERPAAGAYTSDRKNQSCIWS